MLDLEHAPHASLESCSHVQSLLRVDCLIIRFFKLLEDLDVSDVGTGPFSKSLLHKANLNEIVILQWQSSPLACTDARLRCQCSVFGVLSLHLVQQSQHSFPPQHVICAATPHVSKCHMCCFEKHWTQHQEHLTGEPSGQKCPGHKGSCYCQHRFAVRGPPESVMATRQNSAGMTRFLSSSYQCAWLQSSAHHSPPSSFLPALQSVKIASTRVKPKIPKSDE